MSIWFFIVLVIGIAYALNRLTSTTDLPVSARLAQAREILEHGGHKGDATRPDATPPVMATQSATSTVRSKTDQHTTQRAA